VEAVAVTDVVREAFDLIDDALFGCVTDNSRQPTTAAGVLAYLLAVLMLDGVDGDPVEAASCVADLRVTAGGWTDKKKAA
jgi:hypothetical protein